MNTIVYGTMIVHNLEKFPHGKDYSKYLDISYLRQEAKIL